MHTAIQTCIRANTIGSRAYPRSGYYIMRCGSDYMMIRCGRVPFGGVSTHYHNDALSFELQVGGIDFIIDPGTYMYTADPAWRNHFRSTAAHNTPVVNGQEQNSFEHSVFDYVGDSARARCLEWKSSDQEDVFVGEHKGFRVGNRIAVVQRRISFAKSARVWHIADLISLSTTNRIRATDRFDITWRFHLHPEVFVECQAGNRFRLRRGNRHSLTIELRGTDEFRQYPDWVSSRYGQKQQGPVLCVVSNVKESCRIEFLITVEEGMSA